MRTNCSAMRNKPPGGPPEGSLRPADLAAGYLTGFITELRRAGVRAVVDKQADFLRAVSGSPPGLTALYWYARITLVSDIAEVAAFDRVFDEWFRHGRGQRAAVAPPPDATETEVQSPRQAGDRDLPLREAVHGSGIQASALATQGRRSFGSAQQRELARQLRDAWLGCLPATTSPRRVPGRSGDRLDLPRVWRQALRHGGEIAELRWRRRPMRVRRLLLLVDVSGSLRQHTPDLLRLAHTAAQAAPGRTEVFTFGTQLTRVTSALSDPRAGRALEAVSDRVTDADGGTAIGAAMEQFLGNPRFAALARGAVVVVMSDGLERGDCAAMVRCTARLSRLGYRFVWWSPLACSPRYRPVTRGMAAQLASLDHLGGVRDLRSGLDEVRRLPVILLGPRHAAGRRWSVQPLQELPYE